MRAARFLRAALAAAGCVFFLSCSDDARGPGPVPQPSPQPTVTPTPTLSRVTIEGNATLTAVGQTTQLIARATYADGTSADVTSQSAWTSTMPDVISVTPSGTASAVALGNTSVSARFQTRTGLLKVIATPPGTLTVSGQVREPGQGGGGAGIRPAGVRVFEPVSGASLTTDGDGQFSLGGLTSLRVHFERADLEPKEVDLTANGYNDVAVQRIVRINAGETATPVPLAPNDLNYTMNGGEVCFPCRMIRVDVPAAGTLQLRLKWATIVPASSLGLWVNGVFYQPSSAQPEVAVTVSVSAGQRVVFVEGLGPSANISFTLETTFSP